MNGSASSRHRTYRDRRARGALVVKIELNPARIARLIHCGYIAADATGDRASLARGVEELIDGGPVVARASPPPPQSAPLARGDTTGPPPAAATRPDVTHALPQPPWAARAIDQLLDAPPWEAREPLARRVSTNLQGQASAASKWWPSDGELYAAYGGPGSLYAQAVRDWQRCHCWRDRVGQSITDRKPIPEDFLQPAEAMRIHTLGDPIEALRRRRAGL